ncbi:hypothetical protein HHI36_023281 [Cryptolaemus montrouzieri]|uniref:Uncharacterized protein n=1 Tax=Cryptolaemus montrouzieri TaxID=559131 RepID=A0ABD2PGG5_9CUCU
MLPRKCNCILLLLFLVQQVPGINIETVKYCCNLGTNHSIAGNQCNNFPTSIKGVNKTDAVRCLHSMEICCQTRERNMQCEAGEILGLSGQDCNSTIGAKKDCCETCVLGKDSSTLNPSCEDYLNLGSSFIKCCQAALTSSTTTTTARSTTSEKPKSTASTSTSESADKTTPDYLPPMENLCEVEGICGQICIPMGDSYKCDCNKGFSLMDDKVSCKPDQKNKKAASRCDLNNPCEHKCVDTGVAVKCLCREGYELDIDKTSCKDIDECTLGFHECNENEICVNEDGTYYCEDPSFTDSPIDYDKNVQ